MKTYLPQIEPRIFVRPNQTFGILNYDLDNAYPQRMLALAGQSPTAKACWGKRAKFIGGNGFVKEGLGDVVVNARGTTIAKILVATSTDKALFTGFGIHVNWNANYKVSSVNYVRFEDIRMGDIDNPDYKGKFVLYSDWGRRTWKTISRNRLAVLDPFNPSPEVIKEQVINAGGWENYKGQLFYFNPEVDDYPLIEADSVWEDFETEAGIKVFNNREVTTGFMPSTIISVLGRREQGDNDSGTQDGLLFKQQQQLDNNFARFQSAKESNKIVFIEYEDPTSKPEITPYEIANHDKLFEVTSQAVENRIIKGFNIPRELINSDKASGLSNGGEKKEAIREFNDATKPERAEISFAFYEIFKNWAGELPNDNNWDIIPIPDNVADLNAGGKVGAAITNMLLTDMPFENKVWQMVNIYGFNEAEARQMTPVEGTFTPINLKLPGAIPEPTTTETEGENK